ncbi:MAG: hypothetical protein V5A36_06855 [Natronomonas sp.]
MPTTRRTVLERLAAATDAERRNTTTIGAIASALDIEKDAVKAHLDGLADCELARIYPDGSVRVTITGEEFLALEADEAIIIDSSTHDTEQ